MRLWRLDSGPQSLVFAAEEGVAACAHWGAALPDAPEAVEAAARRDVSGGMLDALPPLSLSPQARRSFPGQPGLILRDAQDALLEPDWRFDGAEQGAGRLALHHRAEGLRLSFLFVAQAHGLISARTRLEADSPIHVDWMAAPVLPVPDHLGEILDFTGRWTGEFRLLRTPFASGARLRESRGGRSGHDHPPHLMLAAPGATNLGGEVHALHYGWSGGCRALLEEMPCGRRQVQFGDVMGSRRGVERAFETAELLLAYGAAGLNSVAVPVQRLLRDRLPPARQPRPVHMNSWEAVYFDHDLATLTEIASRAAALGAERFVLDDGWFRGRNDDATSLGDWEIDPDKHPDGFAPLLAHLDTLGMGFGLWVEPEMISKASALFVAHPDWVLGSADQIRGRGQLHLDMARPEVRDHLFARLDALLRDWPIEYLKWDHNRLPPYADAAQVEGLYALLDRLRAAHPGVEMESCASGGGRIDAAILRRCARVWLSDSNDPVERLRIQHEAALLLPGAAVGAHIGPRASQTSARLLPMGLRAWTAAQRHLGFEFDPRELTEEEARILARITAWWKANRDWLAEADILRLDAPPEMLAELHLSAGGERFVVFAAQIESAPQILPRALRLGGLDPAARYRVALTERAEGPSRGGDALSEGPLTLSGAHLMRCGVIAPCQHPQTIAVIEGSRV